MRQSTRNQVPITKQREFLHVIPPLAIQRSVADQLDTLDETRREWAVVYTKKLSSIADLKQSILRKAFTGELT
jgi:type I restriction enzyme S subunit